VLSRPSTWISASRNSHPPCNRDGEARAQRESLHNALWSAHFYLAFIFFALILLHLAAALFHALVCRDGVFEAMAPVLPRSEVAPPE